MAVGWRGMMSGLALAAALRAQDPTGYADSRAAALRDAVLTPTLHLKGLLLL